MTSAHLDICAKEVHREDQTDHWEDSCVVGENNCLYSRIIETAVSIYTKAAAIVGISIEENSNWA